MALYIRNLILNWSVLLPALCALLLALKFIVVILDWARAISPLACGSHFTPMVAGSALIFLLFNLWVSVRFRPSSARTSLDQNMFLLIGLLPVITAAYLFSYLGALPCTEIIVRDSSFRALSAQVSLAFGAIYASAWLLAWPRFVVWKRYLSNFAGWIIAGLAHGFFVFVGIYIFIMYLSRTQFIFTLTPERFLLILGVPWVLFSQFIAETLYVAFSSLGDSSDGDQEWLARSAGLSLITVLGWLAAMVTAAAGSEFAWLIFSTPLGLALALTSFGVAWVSGRSGLSPAVGVAQNWKQGFVKNASIISATAIAIVILMSASALLDQLLYGQRMSSLLLSMNQRVSLDDISWPSSANSILIAFVIALAVGVFTSFVVNVNRFSLHALYRNRLIRAFLGASHMKREPDAFTDFDEKDNLWLASLWHASDASMADGGFGSGWRPFHILNMALNTVSVKKLAWQERKAEPFFASPLHAGSSYKGFRRSSEYSNTEGGITLGTAMAISGAAASPNMGYHSSPAVAFLFSIFNMRLGWWLGNPGKEGDRTYTHSAPVSALIPLIYETFGLTTDYRKYVYLSDGGHFDNLGLYEMVRRRCRFILVIDAGRDPHFGFYDLGDAIRKIAIDLGITIKFTQLLELKKRPVDGSDVGPDRPYHALGEIDYSKADGFGEKGRIVYVKAGYHGVESPAVTSYAVENRDFPHEATSNQWFSESQFESYRALGFEIMGNALASVRDNLEASTAK